MSLDEQLAVRPDHPERAPGHAELSVWGGGGRFDLELTIDPPDPSVELDRN